MTAEPATLPPMETDMAKTPPYPGTPRWVWWARLAAVLTVISFVAMHLAGLAPTHRG